ncbi:MAG: response regulator [Calditrichia bacterium]
MLNRILIADDSAIARSIIKRVLEINGLVDIEIFEAENGKIALDLLKKNPCDLVFTDLNMPDMSGEELLKRIKSSPRLTDIPVIVISSLTNPAKEKKLIKENALAVFTKPVSLPEISRFLKSYQNMNTGDSNGL